MLPPPQTPQTHGQKNNKQHQYRHARKHGAVARLIKQVKSFHHAFVAKDENEGEDQDCNNILH
jgi:hypothetical protein